MKQMITKEEHDRMKRRRKRQAVGLVAVILMLIGLGTLFNAARCGIGSLFDQSEQMAEYQNRLEGFVMFDPMPFSGIGSMDDNVLHEVAVWGCIYRLQETGGLENFARDEETEQMLLPMVEVDAYLAKIVGPSFKMTHKSFEMDDMNIEYDEVRKAYLIPVTGGVGSYRPEVKEMFKKEGILHVTVGYIPLANSEDFTTNVADKPSKYMDYLFERAKGSWYLVGLEENTTQTVETAGSVETTVTVPDEDVQQTILDVAGVDEIIAEEPAEESAEEQSEGETSSTEGETSVEVVAVDSEHAQK